MATTVNVSFEVPELARVLKGVDPAVFLVPARVLRRVIKHDRRIGGVGLLVPHRKTYVIDREPLLRIVDRDELGVASADEVPAKAILVVRPEPDELARMTLEETLVLYWQLLFHARLDLALRQKLADGSLDAAGLRQRILRLGTTEFDEAVTVLRQEQFLLPPEDPGSVYAEFVAVYLTLRRFQPARVRHFFPGLCDLDKVDTLVAREVDADALYAATR